MDKRRTLVVGLVLLAVVGLLLYRTVLLRRATTPPPDIHLQTVEVKEVASASLEDRLSLSGSLESANKAVISPKVAGRVARILVENGNQVQSGQPLVLLDNQAYQNQLAAAQATLKKAEANLEATRTNHQRIKQMYQGGVVSQKDFDDIEAGLKAAEADASSAAAAASIASEDLANTTITSPIPGMVANRQVNLGQMISPGLSVMDIEDISSIYIVVNVNQDDIGRIAAGEKAEVLVDPYVDRLFPGTVEVVNPSANPYARVFQAKVKVDNQEGLLRPGMFARVVIQAGEAKEAVTIPQIALAGQNERYYVFVLEGDRVRRQTVTIGGVQNGTIEIRTGLTQGQKVVVTNVNKLKDQDQVRIAGGQGE